MEFLKYIIEKEVQNRKRAVDVWSLFDSAIDQLPCTD